MGKRGMLGSIVAFAVAVVSPIAPAAAVSITDISFHGTGTLPTATLNTTFHPDYSGSGPFQIGTGVVISGFDVTSPDFYPTNFFAYCIDIFEGYDAGEFAISGLSGVTGDRIAALLSHAAPPATAESAGAAQLALWEILYDDGLVPYDLSAGAFFVTDVADAGDALAIAGGYLANVQSGTWSPLPRYSFTVLTNRGAQDLITFSAVPEPANWTMLIGGFGIAGAALRARRRIAHRLLA